MLRPLLRPHLRMAARHASASRVGFSRQLVENAFVVFLALRAVAVAAVGHAFVPDVVEHLSTNMQQNAFLASDRSCECERTHMRTQCIQKWQRNRAGTPVAVGLEPAEHTAWVEARTRGQLKKTAPFQPVYAPLPKHWRAGTIAEEL